MQESYLKPNIFTLSKDLAHQIIDTCSHFIPSIDTDMLLLSVSKSCRAQLKVLPEINPLLQRIERDLGNAPGARGFLIIDVSRFIINDFYATGLGVLIPLTALCGLVGTPFRVFERYNLWKPIIVDTNVAPQKANGVGYNPFHIDFVNSTSPPDYICLFCIKIDPAGGG